MSTSGLRTLPVGNTATVWCWRETWETKSSPRYRPDVWKKASDLLRGGVPAVWIIDPTTLESELHTPDGIQQVIGKTLRAPNSAIEISLIEAMEE